MTVRKPHPQLLEYLRAYDPSIVELALALRQLILEEAPSATEAVYQVYTVAVYFGFGEKMNQMFCYLTTHTAHINLGFPRGAALADPQGVLEGEGKTIRHIKIKTLSDLERPFLRRYIQAAMEQTAPGGAQGTGETIIKSADKKAAQKKR